MLAVVAWFVGSAVFVDFVGYWLHRWAHVRESHMYRAHMTHHAVNYPPHRFFSSEYRSSGGDGLARYFLPFGVAYAVLLALACPSPLAAILGGLAVAGASSLLHDLTHIEGSIAWRIRPLKHLAEHHRTHHLKMGRNFGILCDVWDRLFRTHRPAAG